jgi:DNA uptake protein ComE-like DNA-binding protein
MKSFPSLLVLVCLGALGLAAHAESIYTLKPSRSATANPDAAASKDSRIDINTASLTQLKTLKGINDEKAQRIIATRPHLHADSLVLKEALNIQELESIKALIRAN